MASLNLAQVIGNLTRDPEVKQTPNGKTVATFSVATNSKWTDASGEKHEEVEFHNIVAWGRLAEICEQYLKKGSQAYFSGSLKTRSWEGQDGKKMYKTEIVAREMLMLGAKSAGQSVPVATAAPAATAAADLQGAAPPANAAQTKLDDLPF